MRRSFGVLAIMYGLIGKILAKPGCREELVETLMASTESMPGCRSYVVAIDPRDENGVWVTEVWDSAEAHAASLQLPSVQAAIAKAKPIIAGFGERFETEPRGGHGV